MKIHVITGASDGGRFAKLIAPALVERAALAALKEDARPH